VKPGSAANVGQSPPGLGSVRCTTVPRTNAAGGFGACLSSSNSRGRTVTTASSPLLADAALPSRPFTRWSRAFDEIHLCTSADAN